MQVDKDGNLVNPNLVRGGQIKNASKEWSENCTLVEGGEPRGLVRDQKPAPRTAKKPGPKAS